MNLDYHSATEQRPNVFRTPAFRFAVYFSSVHCGMLICPNRLFNHENGQLKHNIMNMESLSHKKGRHGCLKLAKIPQQFTQHHAALSERYLLRKKKTVMLECHESDGSLETQRTRTGVDAAHE